MAKSPLLIRGMHGMGDNIHQRALLRQLLPDYEIWLKTSWACIYHDLIDQGLHLIREKVNLRTQTKNAEREAAKFEGLPSEVRSAPPLQVMYHGFNVQRQPSRTILSAMLESAHMGLRFEGADYRLPIPEAWQAEADAIIAEWAPTKPLLIYRPLSARPEWQGGAMRNADAGVYTKLFATIRDSFFVVSLADLDQQREWYLGPQLRADVDIRDGRYPFETIAGLFKRAALVYTSSGFGAVLAPAVETPVISIVGGYERAQWHLDQNWSPALGIEPINPCACAVSTCGRRCNKETDMNTATARIREFVEKLGISTPAESRPFSEIYGPEVGRDGGPAIIQRHHTGAAPAHSRPIANQRQVLRHLGLKV
jgi:ADP-heptose:LPS heptosyltransferase